MFLSYLASGGYYGQHAFRFGVATCTAFTYTHEVADFLLEIAPQHISLPEPNEFQALSSPLRGPGGNLLNVILYIDGMETITQS
jgi:hypothetical protein